MPPRLNFLTTRPSISSLRCISSISSAFHFSVASAATTLWSSSILPAYSPSPGKVQQKQRQHQRRMKSPRGKARESFTAGNKSNAGMGQGAAEGEKGVGINQDQLPHVSDEAAGLARMLDKIGCPKGRPELEQGTPVEDILRRDKEAMKNAPKVMRDQIASSIGRRSYATSARLRTQDISQLSTVEQSRPSLSVVTGMIAAAGEGTIEPERTGYKFDMPELPLPRSENVKRRYDPLVEQFTKLLMRHGKLSAARKNMVYILDHLRRASPPQTNPDRPLLPGPPTPQLPLNPILYLTLVIDSVAPLLKIRQQKGAAGGGMSLPIPVPLSLRQRRRTAIRWIIDASDRRSDGQLAVRVANEIVAVAEGRSSVWERRGQVHKQGVGARSNLKWAPMSGRKR